MPNSALERYNAKYPPKPGDVRVWRKCNTCAKVYSYDYLPYSIGNPTRWTPCGHSVGHRNLNCVEITEEEANDYLAAREPAPALAVPSFGRSSL